MNIPYLLKILETDKVSELVANIEATPLDIDLALEDAQAAGQIKVDKEADHIEVLKEAEPSGDPELANKLLRTIQNYARQNTNITRGRMNALVKDPMTGAGYAWHDYITSLHYLIDTGVIEQAVVDVPRAVKKFMDKKGRQKEKEIRPAHKFAFLQLPENGENNAEWNAKIVNKWIDDFAKVK